MEVFGHGVANKLRGGKMAELGKLHWGEKKGRREREGERVCWGLENNKIFRCLMNSIKAEGRKDELNNRGANKRKNAVSSLTQEKNNHVQHTWVINQLSLAIKSCQEICYKAVDSVISS